MTESYSNDKTYNNSINLLAGGLGGMISSIVTNPLDLIKTRAQSDLYFGKSKKKKLHRSPIKLLKSVYTEEGFFSLFKGLNMNMIGIVPSKAINFYSYSSTKHFLINNININENQSIVYLISGMVAGITTSTITNPIWVIKTRLQLNNSFKKKTTIEYVSSMIQNEGIFSLYKGLFISYLGCFESTLQWILYENLKKLIKKNFEHNKEKNSAKFQSSNNVIYLLNSIAAGTSKLISTLITYPHEIVRTRLRQPPGCNGIIYKNMIHCFTLILKNEGFRSFYNGLSLHLLKTVPNSIVTFGVWEFTFNLLTQHYISK